MSSEEWTLDDIKRFLRWTVRMLILAATIYLGDWAIWKVKVARGAGMGSLTVSRFVVAPLKGGKEEYYSDGSALVACSQSLFPQGGGDACWWLARHPVIYDR